MSMWQEDECVWAEFRTEEPISWQSWWDMDDREAYERDWLAERLPFEQDLAASRHLTETDEWLE